ncbi:thioredoxin family protein [Virgibacillus halodenitrificans]|uniref:thioredoxin family protein n=1 Tax=Virgibacillus halodenitrificans TaxID=1482 RepID=UPI000EF44F77|nr:thioredoxin family protein [Virgibacillus halodenitrificans]
MSNKNDKKKNTIIIFVISAVIIGLVVGVIIYNENETAKAEKLYQKDEVHSASIKALEDPNYQNIILPGELDKKIEEEVFVYFFSPLCKFCEESKGDIAKAFVEADVEYYQLNLLEFDEGYQKYGVRGTPAIFHYKDGIVVDNIYGSQSYRNYLEWIKSQGK